MIPFADAILRDLLLAHVAGLRPVGGGAPVEGQVRFQPPDDRWQTYVSNLVVGTPAGPEHVNALNVYLVDLRENRKLRTNETVRTAVGPDLFEQPAPVRLDCHYLVTAWSPVQETPATEPALDEHTLLADVAAVLFEHAPLNASRVYPPGSPALAALPAALQDADLPLHVLPPDGFPRLGDFWNAMGARGRWKPALYLVLTVPLPLEPIPSGPEVTTVSAEWLPGSEVLLDIGGRVLDPVGRLVGGAWVRLETTGGHVLQETTADVEGRFRFARVGADTYVIRAGGTGVAGSRTIDVPSPSGEYDLHLHAI